MFSSIWEDLKREFKYGNAVSKLMIVNFSAFVLFYVTFGIVFLIKGAAVESSTMQKVQYLFSLPAKPWTLLLQPWSIITHMFLHVSVWHIIWNMLALYWFGRIVGDLINDRRVIPLYIMGGLAGGLAYFVSANLLGYTNNADAYAFGASAAVMAVAACAGKIAPDYLMHLILIGTVKLKWVVFTLVFINIMSMAVGDNIGGVFGHLGGAVYGFIFAAQLHAGRDWSLGFNRLFSRLGGSFKRMRTDRQERPQQQQQRRAHEQARARQTASMGSRSDKSKSGRAASDYQSMSQQEQVDAILDKIKQSGYESLSNEEKEFLFNASKN
jgi:membrane associated rhomboid family serine protease